MCPEKIVVFGITGSIGLNTEKVISAFPDNYSIVGCSCGKNIEKLNEIITRHSSITDVCVTDDSSKYNVKGRVQVHSGEEGLFDLLVLWLYRSMTTLRMITFHLKSISIQSNRLY